MWFSLFQRCQKQNNRYFNFRGYKGRRKLKTANINPHVFGANPRKFGDAKIYHFTVCSLLVLINKQKLKCNITLSGQQSFFILLLHKKVQQNLATNITVLSKKLNNRRIADINEPRHEKTNILVSNLVRHKLGCTVTEDG